MRFISLLTIGTCFFCSRPQEKDDNKRVVIITAFGVHDAQAQAQFMTSQQEQLPSNVDEYLEQYVEHLPQDVIQADGVRAAALAACREATAQTVRAAAGDDSSSSRSSPLVFLLQNNNYAPGSFQQTFLDEVRQAQRQDIGLGIGETQTSNDCEGGDESTTNGGGILGGNGENNGDDARGRVFLVENSASLYDRLSCYQQKPESHYLEPVKLVEAKMLWDLFALVDRETSSPATPATSRATVDETVDAAAPLPVAGTKEDVTASGSSPAGADAVWSRLLEAASLQDECESPPCGKVRNVVCMG